jgi:hypothetical protein
MRLQLNFMRNLLSVLFPPKFPEIESQEEQDQWLRFAVPNHSKLDPFNPGEVYSSAGNVVEHSPVPPPKTWRQSYEEADTDSFYDGGYFVPISR